MTAAADAANEEQRTAGIAWAIAACLFWGGAFAAPLVLTGYSAVDISAGRFLGAGLFSLIVLAALRLKTGQNLPTLPVWWVAFYLSFLGGFVYFAAMTAGVQRANAAIVTLIIGLLPIGIPLVAQVRDGTFSWRQSGPPMSMMFAGLLLVHGGAHPGGLAGAMDGRYLSGIALAVVALLAWLIFALANTRELERLPTMSAVQWSCLQGVALLPMAALLIGVAAMTSNDAASVTAEAGKPSFLTFVVLSTGLGIATSWLAMWCWNRASQLLSPAMAGQLLVFETIFSLTYVYGWIGSWPPVSVVLGAALLIGGVVLGLRAINRKAAAIEQ